MSQAVPRELGRDYWFALGVAPLVLLAVQLVTGLALALHYQPGQSAVESYASVRRITEQVSFGWYLRSVHRGAATLMILTALLHQLRVLLTHCGLGRRWLSWMLGCGLLGLTAAATFTGDGLVGEPRGTWALEIAGKLCAALPGVGRPLSRLLLAGDGLGPHTLPRIYALHATAIPLALVLGAALHVALSTAHGSGLLDAGRAAPRGKSVAGGDASRTIPLWPDQARIDLGVALALLLVLNTFAMLAPVRMGPPADPLTTPTGLQPIWFLWPAMAVVRRLPRGAALLVLGATMVAALGWPALGSRPRATRRQRDIAASVGALLLCAIVGLGLWESFHGG